MRTPRYVTKWIFAVYLIAGCLCSSFASEINPYLDPAQFSAKGSVFELGPCKIMVLQTYFWRDWMPIVDRPGPDRGSPLHAKIKLKLDNSMGGTNKLSFQAVIVDDKGQSHSVPFHVLPNFQVLPEAVWKSYRNLDEETKRSVVAKYNVMWNGELKPGETREVDLSTSEGPYLPVGSIIHVEITWMDQQGNTLIVRTPDERIHRTD
jgi:hypothetical protein